MEEFENIIGYKFKDKELINIALTHTSYANEHRCKSYERLEFLGDSVLSLIVSKFLFQKMRNVSEGDLSRIRASLVCEETLAEIARKIKLGDFILLGNGEEKSGSRDRDSILADVFEATLAAIYLDSDLQTVKVFLLNIMHDELNNAVLNKTYKDYKSRLQEYIQHNSHGKSKIIYTTIKESGPEHRKTFMVELSINGKICATGSGNSKKEAEQEAAKQALALTEI